MDEHSTTMRPMRIILAAAWAVAVTWYCWILVVGVIYTSPRGPARLWDQTPGIAMACVLVAVTVVGIRILLGKRWLTPWLLLAALPPVVGVFAHL